MKNNKDKIIYVGKAKSLKARVRSYFNKSQDHSVKTTYLVNQISNIDYIVTNTEVEAFLLEASLIKKHRPRYNIRLKDDKAYPYIKVGMSHSFPRLYLSRKVTNDGSAYFGPYTSGLAVRETIKFLNRTFKIRDCSDGFYASRKRPCMTYQIDRCTGPCVGLIDEKEYLKDVQSSLSYLRGKSNKVKKDLEKKMLQASKEEKFELAAKYRDSLKSIQAIWEKQSVISSESEKDVDVIACCGDEKGTLIETLHIRSGRVIGTRPHYILGLNINNPTEDPKEWMTSFLNQYYADNIVPDEILMNYDLGGDIIKLLGDVLYERSLKRPKIYCTFDNESKSIMELAEKNAYNHLQDQLSKANAIESGLEEVKVKFNLEEFPKRIECFDVSHFQGSQTVASQVVFENGEPKKEDYRKYKINSVIGPDDYASMKEVLTRRLSHKEWDDPQLIVIDGGKGQLKIAMKVLKELNRSDIPLVGLAKARSLGEFTDVEVNETQERFFLPGRQNPLVFRRGSQALKILVQLRDEAHRFAIEFHRSLRGKELLKSKLDEIKGVGSQKKKLLLKTFGSIANIQNAGEAEILKLEGFNKKLVEKILNHLENPDTSEKDDVVDIGDKNENH